ncbi:bifunctional folylpolyglutamate synthase/dihydrofolate synthase [Bacillus sp. DNRA2]|uniref:bifunctional folylpolyglutamate synthase/dihydrofolate synthase n=1 Tax=Bacillus sp. DNRA2 TaxID=2723053 RepID=UPI00145D3EE2|nr:folylpolyglutamate synthase/dihydrofolate synthase family protein [Bacillus sp. DNRA2]NMD70522.1 bifunctional folylpolyglutamate synthase/dihydrofolate synthase [Bacillus sp. DNRA2]
MFQTYDEALDWIHGRLRLGIKPGLKRMEWMMERLNHPERNIKTIHIGGTNGKGSTLTFLRSILEEAGYYVGTFTSPYFEHFNERISINGKPISDKEMLELANTIKPLAEELEKTELGGPTEFEVITAMALYYFAKINPVDIALFEVGLGGRFDSTNVIHPLLSIITSIGLDHTNILGDTYEQIASEKAGIIKNGVPIITAVKQPEAQQVILDKAKQVNASLYQLGTEFKATDILTLPNGAEFNFSSALLKALNKLQISMLGQHQIDNAALAVMASQILSQFYAFLFDEQQIRKGLNKAYWPGRFELISAQPTIIIDGAHNQEGIDALANELKQRYQGKRINIFFTALADKKLDKMIAKLDETADNLIFTQFDYPRASKAEDLAALSSHPNKQIEPDWREGLQRLLQQQAKTLSQQKTDNEILVITGSLYFLSEVKPYLLQLLK